MTGRRRRLQFDRCLRLNLAGVFVLVAGLAVAALIYFAATDEEREPLAYEFVNGSAYAIDARDSKMYRHDLERFGGKAALLADDLNRWLASWTHGKRLALLVAGAALAIAVLTFRAAARASGPGPNDTR